MLCFTTLGASELLTSTLNGGRRRKTFKNEKRTVLFFFPAWRIKAFSRERHWVLILRIVRYTVV